MKIIKTLLLIILLVFIPQVSASIEYINQPVYNSQTSTNTVKGQTFITGSTQKTISNISVIGASTGISSDIFICIFDNPTDRNLLGCSETKNLPNNDLFTTFNFTPEVRVIGSTSYFMDTNLTVARLRNSLLNPYPDGNYYEDNVSVPPQDLAFTVSGGANVGNWTFNQGTGNYANDSSGFNLNASKTAGSMGWSTNLVNGSVNASSLNFDGSTYLSITNSTGLASDQLNFSYITPYSIDVWVRTNNTPLTSSNVIVSKINSAFNGGYELNYSNGKIYWVIARNTDANSLVVNTSSVVISSAWTWYHILATYDGSSSTSGATIYVNGVSTPLQSLVNTVSGESRTSTLLKIGSQSGTTNFINATMDELKIYNYALNVSEGNIVYQQYQPAGGYPTGNYTITPSGATEYINFSWHDNLYSSDELIIATDSSFTAIIHDGFHNTDFSNISLTSNQTYYWKVRQFNSGTGSYGNVSEVQKFTISKFNGYLNILVLDEMTFLKVNNYNATIYNGVVKSKSTINGVVNFTSSDIEPGQFQLVITVNSTYGERAIIVNSPGNYTVYVPSTTAYTVDFVSFYLLDYTGRFPYANTNLTITKGVNITHSQDFDSDAKAAANLIRGERYTLTVYNPSTSDMQTWGDYSSSGTGSVQVVISAFGINESVLKPYAQSISRDGNDINFAWNDRNNVLNWVNITVYQDNYSYLVYSLNTSINAGTATFTITNTSALYFAQMNASTTRSDTIDSLIIDLRTGTELIRNLSYGSFSIPAWFKNALAIVLMFMLAGSFGAMHRGEGAIITGFIGVYLWYVGWLIMSTAIAVLFGSMVMFAILYHMNTKSKPGYF